MIAISPRRSPVGRTWNKIGFPSTLYLSPILDMLLSEVPRQWQAEVRLGLQEALVNAAKHGNKLDPNKTVVVYFRTDGNRYWWRISDEGNGFACPSTCRTDRIEGLPEDEGECGRGLFILHQVFDEVHWNNSARELKLCKQLKSPERLPLVR